MRPVRPVSSLPGPWPKSGVACQVAAPSKLLRPSGERVKTDRRDAILLARLARNDDIVAVRVPTRSQEGARDLVRSRADARGDLMTARHRLSKMLLRRGIVYDGARGAEPGPRGRPGGGVSAATT